MTQGGLQDLANQNALKIVAKVGYYCIFRGPHNVVVAIEHGRKSSTGKSKTGVLPARLLCKQKA